MIKFDINNQTKCFLVGKRIKNWLTRILVKDIEKMVVQKNDQEHLRKKKIKS